MTVAVENLFPPCAPRFLRNRHRKSPPRAVPRPAGKARDLRKRNNEPLAERKVRERILRNRDALSG